MVPVIDASFPDLIRPTSQCAAKTPRHGISAVEGERRAIVLVVPSAPTDGSKDVLALRLQGSGRRCLEPILEQSIVQDIERLTAAYQAQMAAAGLEHGGTAAVVEGERPDELAWTGRVHGR